MLFLRFVFGAVAALVTIAIQLQPQLGHFNQQQLFNRRQCMISIHKEDSLSFLGGNGKWGIGKRAIARTLEFRN